MDKMLGELLWDMNSPIWKNICLARANEYVTGNYEVRTTEDGYAVWHDEGNIRILDDLGYKGENYGVLKTWFKEATDTIMPIRLSVMGKNEKLRKFYETHSFKVIEETPYLYIMERRG